MRPNLNPSERGYALRLPRFSLVGKFWRVPDVGRVTLIPPGAARLAEVNADWAPLRPPRHTNRHWSWLRIRNEAKETFAVIERDEPRTTFALLSSKAPVVKLEAGDTGYELSYAEAHPNHRGDGILASFVLGLAAERAHELGYARLLLPSLPETAQRWIDLGAVVGPIPGWNVPEGLVPCMITGVRFTELREAVHEAAE